MKSNVFITSSGVAWKPTILFAQKELGVNQIMYAIDYLYQAHVNEVAASDHNVMDDTIKLTLFQTNAKHDFKMNERQGNN